jgi:hypothetical protein
MTEEPENHTLRLLREMREEMKTGFSAANERFDRLEAESKTQSALLGKVLDATLKIAATQQIHGGRLNMIEARLAEIERETGLVKA